MGKSSRQHWCFWALFVALVACGASAAELNTGYVVSNQGALGITRAFDDGPNTILAFVDLETQHPVLTDAAGKKIRYHQVDNYAVLPGRYTEVHVVVGRDTGIVRSAVMQPPAPVSTTPYVASAKVPPSTKDVTTSAPAPTHAAPPVAACSAHKTAKPCSDQATTIPAAKLPLKPLEPPHADKPVVATPKPAPKAPLPVWTTKGEWLRPALADWAKQAGWRIRWLDSTGKPTDTDRKLDNPLRFEGSFQDAVKQCIELYAAAGDHLAFDSYPLSKMIIITETN
jgi:hypothetical protein